MTKKSIKPENLKYNKQLLRTKLNTQTKNKSNINSLTQVEQEPTGLIVNFFVDYYNYVITQTEDKVPTIKELQTLREFLYKINDNIKEDQKHKTFGEFLIYLGKNHNIQIPNNLYPEIRQLILKLCEMKMSEWCNLKDSTAFENLLIKFISNDV